MAPELYNGENYEKSVDWWALGVMIFYMITSEYPFDVN